MPTGSRHFAAMLVHMVHGKSNGADTVCSAYGGHFDSLFAAVSTFDIVSVCFYQIT